MLIPVHVDSLTKGIESLTLGNIVAQSAGINYLLGNNLIKRLDRFHAL